MGVHNSSDDDDAEVDIANHEVEQTERTAMALCRRHRSLVCHGDFTHIHTITELTHMGPK